MTKIYLKEYENTKLSNEIDNVPLINPSKEKIFKEFWSIETVWFKTFINSEKEIDLLIEYNNVVYPIGIKKSANPSKEAIKNFDVTKEFNKDIGTGIVLCMIREITPIDEHNYFVPIEYL